MKSAKAVTFAFWLKSAGKMITALSGNFEENSLFSSSKSRADRAQSARSNPPAANLSAMALPIPLVAPLTIIRGFDFIENVLINYFGQKKRIFPKGAALRQIGLILALDFAESKFFKAVLSKI